MPNQLCAYLCVCVIAHPPLTLCQWISVDGNQSRKWGAGSRRINLLNREQTVIEGDCEWMLFCGAAVVLCKWLEGFINKINASNVKPKSQLCPRSVYFVAIRFLRWSQKTENVSRFCPVLISLIKIMAPFFIPYFAVGPFNKTRQLAGGLSLFHASREQRHFWCFSMK